jgi:hypothetical protein
MKKVLFVNSSVKECGVYQYGLRLGNIITRSTEHEVRYAEVFDLEGFRSLDISDIDVILFNYIEVGPGGPFGWVEPGLCTELKQKYKIGTILHTAWQGVEFDFKIDQDPDGPLGIPRPLPLCSELSTTVNDIVTVGSFGFQGDRKGFEDILTVVSDQFEQANINLHITSNFYGDSTASCRDLQVQNIRNISLKEGIKLTVTTEFINDNETINFLSKNDINLFPYKGGEDISSVIDYAIASCKPFGVTTARCFRHVYDKNIDIKETSIKDMIEFSNSTNYVQNIKKSWSPEKLIETFNIIINNI